jgi:hypothetical protein
MTKTPKKWDRTDAVDIAGQLIALGRGPKKGPLPQDGRLTIRKSRAKTDKTEDIFYLDGGSTGIRERESEAAFALHLAATSTKVHELIGRGNARMLPIEKVIVDAVGPEPPASFGDAAHDNWSTAYRKGEILLEVLENVLGEGATLGQLDDASVSAIWRELELIVIAKVIEGEDPKTYSYTYIQMCLSWLRGAISHYRIKHDLKWSPTFRVPSRRVRRHEFLLRKHLADLLWSCRGRIKDTETRKWIREHIIVDGREVERNYIDHGLKKQARGLARAVLIMAYSGTRKTACRNLVWGVHETKGHIDVVAGIIRRSGFGKTETKKTKKPTSLLIDRLLQHCRRWEAADRKHGYVHVIRNRFGRPYTSSFDVTFDSVVDAAGLSKSFIPHSLRRTCVTWQAILGVPIQAAADLVGLSVGTLEAVYRRWCPPAAETALEFWRDGTKVARLKRLSEADLVDSEEPDPLMPKRQRPRRGRVRKTREALRRRHADRKAA